MPDILQKKIDFILKDASTIYLVCELYYIEDYYEAENVFLVTEDESIAKRIVNELNSISENLEKEQDNFYAFREEWYEKNPIQKEEYKKYPKYEAGLQNKDILEMLRKRRMIMYDNAKIEERNQKAEQEAQKQMIAAYNEFAKNNNFIYTAEELKSADIKKFRYREIKKIV